MLYPRNSISPPHILLGAVAQVSDGVVQSSGVNVSVRPEGGVETTGVGVISYGTITNSVYYIPTQAETNYTAFSVVAYKSGCTPVGRTILTDDISGQIEATSQQILSLLQAMPTTIDDALEGYRTNGVGSHDDANGANNKADVIIANIEALDIVLDSTYALVGTVSTDVLNLPYTSDMITIVDNTITDNVVIANITNKVNLTGVTTSFSGAASGTINSIKSTGESILTNLNLVPKYDEPQRHTQDDFNTLNKTADVTITRL